jgi:hypothetical protein
MYFNVKFHLTGGQCIDVGQSEGPLKVGLPKRRFADAITSRCVPLFSLRARNVLSAKYNAPITKGDAVMNQERLIPTALKSHRL